MALIQQVKDGKFIDETTGTGSTSTKSSDKDKKDQRAWLWPVLTDLCAEMQYQDPLEPTSNTEYIAQLATFSQLESQLSVQSTIEAFFGKWSGWASMFIMKMSFIYNRRDKLYRRNLWLCTSQKRRNISFCQWWTLQPEGSGYCCRRNLYGSSDTCRDN